MITFTINSSTSSRYWKMLCLFIAILSLSAYSLSAQECILGEEEVLAKWDFNSNTEACNGLTPSKRRFWNARKALVLDGANTYCPNINTGCGQAIFSGHGFGNTNDFANGVCLAGFNGGRWIWPYNHATDWDPNSTTFNPEAATLYARYTFPAGQPGVLQGFASTLVSRGAADGSVQFEKQGVAVYRNGALIYSTEVALNTGNTGTLLDFPFPATSEFKTDGSAAVEFEVRFAMIHRLRGGLSGFDDFCIRGICGAGGGADVAASPSTCAPDATNNGSITISEFAAGEKYDYNLGTTYTGSKTFATADAIPTDGIIVDTISVKAMSTDYTIRVFREDCHQDVTVTMPPTFCPYNCDFPDATVAVTQATCNGAIGNNDARIDLTGISDATRIGMSVGQTYTGPDFAGATDLAGASTYAFENLDNPTCKEYYTIRIFNGADGEPDLCVKTFTVVLDEVSCNGCLIACAEIVGAQSVDTVSTDDIGKGELCVDNGNIDLELTKTVTPNAGITCPDETEFTWTVTVSNVGDITATDVVVFENLAAGLSADNITTTQGTFNGFGDWKVDSLAPNASATLTFTSKAVAAGTYENCAYVSNALPNNDIDSSPDNDNTANEDDDACATITVTGPSLPTVSKEFSPFTTRPNSPSTLIIRLFNNDTVPIVLTQDFVDVLPNDPAQMTVAPDPKINTLLSGVTATPGASSITVASGTVLLPGLNLLEVDVVAATPGLYCNVIGIGDLATSACTNVDSVVGCLEVGDFVVTPLLSKSFDKEIVEVGDQANLTIFIENRNPTAFNVVMDFMDVMPSGLTLAGAMSGTCPSITDFGGDSLTVGIASGAMIPPGGCTIIVPVTANIAKDYCNVIDQNELVVTGTANGITEMIGNRTLAKATITAVNNPIFDLALKKTLASGQADTTTVGSTVTYDITIYNQGTAEATAINVTDYIPNGLELVTGGAWELSGGNAILVNPIPTLVAGADTTIQIQFTIDVNYTGTSITNTAEITAATGGTDKDSTPDNIDNNDKGGKPQTPTDDNIFGNAMLPGGAPQDENGLTDEDDADPAIIYLKTETVENCAVVLSLDPQDCNTSDNTYSVNGRINFSNAPTTGDLLVVVDGDTTQTFNAPFTSPQSIILTGLNSDGQNHTVVTQFTDDRSCQTSMMYTAPSPCLATSTCSVSATVNAGTCDSATNTYDVTGDITFTNAPATGTLTVAIGGFQQTFAAPFTAPQAYTLTGLVADGSNHTVSVSFSDEVACSYVESYVAPGGCDPIACGATLSITPGACDTGTNTFDLTGSVTFSNAPSTGTLVVEVGGDTVTFAAPFTSPQAFTLNDLIANGQMGQATAYFSDDVGCTATANFDAPDACSSSVCAVSMDLSPSPCADNMYVLSGSVNFVNPPTTGTLTIREGGTIYLDLPLPLNSPLNFTIPGLPADSANHTLQVSFSDDLACTNDFTYRAPGSCSGSCSLSGTVADISCRDNGTDADANDDYTIFSLNPTGTNLGSSYSVTSDAGTVYRLSGAAATNVPYGTVTIFRLPNGSADGTDKMVNIIDDASPECTVGPLTITAPISCSCALIENTIDTAICSNETYLFDGQNLTTAGTYRDTVLTALNCDSIVILNLAILPTVETPVTEEICQGDSYTFNSQDLTTAGTYRDTMTAASGCDSVVVLTLNILDTVQTPISQEICASGSYNFNNQDLTVAGTYRDTMTAANGCDSFIVLTLNVIDALETNLNEAICNGDSYTFDGQALTTAGTYRDTMTAASGCDSILILNLSILNPVQTDLNEAICQGETYTFNGQDLSAAGTYRDTMTGSNTCDSVIVLTLSILDTVQTLISETICEGETYTFDSQNLTTAGTYRATLTAANGCDSSVVLTLNVLPNVETPIAQAICAGDSFTFDGQALTTAGMYRDTMTAANGCDSVIVLTLNILDTVQTPITQDICAGDAFNFNNQSLSTTGTYRDTLTAANGCDSFIVLTLNVIDQIETNVNEAICDGDSYPFDGQALTTAGTYRDTMTAASGCDSILILNLSILNPVQTDLNESICQGDSYTFDGQQLSTSGVYRDTMTGSNTCDSIIVLTLSILDTVQTAINESICDGDSFSFNNQSLSTAGTYRDTLTAANGCDSFVVLTLIILPTSATPISQDICAGDSYTFDGQALTAAGTYRDTMTAANGCDSVIVLTLNVLDTVATPISQDICASGSYNFNNQNLTVAGTYRDTMTAANGCDSFIVLTLNVIDALETTLNEAICDGDSYTFDGQALTTAGTYRDTMTAASGCDSILILNLSILNPVQTDLNEAICQGETYTFNGQDLSAAGTYRDTMTGSNTCDSVIVLTLSILDTVQTLISETICEGETYTFDSQNLTTAGTYQATLTGANGCDSSVVLTLNVLPNVETPIAQAICAGDSYTFDGQTLTATGTYRDTMTAANGCDSVIVLTLNVLDTVQTPISQDICTGDSYNFNNQDLAVAGAYRDTMTAANGCDSFIVLTLNVIDVIETNLNEEICEGESYTFDGQALTTSGTYRDTTTAASGCDSITILTLDVMEKMETAISASICDGDSYAFDGQTLTATGTYQDTLTAAGGCDSIIILTLDVLQPVQTVLTEEICDGDSYTFDNQDLTIAGTYRDTLTAANSCDSIIVLTLNVVDEVTTALSAAICSDDTYIFDEQILTTTGVYIDTLTAASGCDSIITLTLTVNPSTTATVAYEGCENDGYSVTVGGTIYDENNPTGTEVLTNANGCDSTVTVNLVFNEQKASTITYEGCVEDGYEVVVNGIPYSENNPSGTEVLTAANGCDSIVTINLTFQPLSTNACGKFDLALEKSTDSTVVRLGDLVVYQIQVTNEGTVDAYNIGISDFIPTGMSLADENWTATGNVARFNTPIVFLPAGSDYNLYITLKVNDDFTGTSLRNIAEISTADDDNDPTNTPPTDEDSTPDEDPTNGDEDDDDDAIVTVVPENNDIFDLALIETLAPGQEGMVRPGEMVDFKITVFNQGTLPAETIEITQYLPEGLTLNVANTQGWTVVNDSTITITLNAGEELPAGGLAAGEMYMLFIQTVVSDDLSSGKLTARAEISDDGGNNDQDSTPDDDRTNDAGGIPNTSTDDVSDQTPPTDEDDEDPVQIMLLEFDLALTEELITEEPVAPGDEVTAKIKVFNQGDIPADNIKLFAYIPAGLSLADSEWTEMDDSTAMRTLTITGGLQPDEMTMVEIDFVIDEDFMEDILITYAEISDATDEEGNPVTDIDSTPDDDRTNDTGGEVDTNTDDQIFATPPVDEDDHDPVKIPVRQVFDLALEKCTDSTVVNLGDLVTYQIKITNEGTVDAYRINISDFIPNGMSLQDANWTATGNIARYNTPIAFLGTGAQTTIEITLQVNPTFTSSSLVNFAEISLADDDTNPTNTPPTDEDSTPDEDPTNEDEDDDDSAVVTVTPPDVLTDIFDLALIETLAPGQEGMVRPGETVNFKITVFNQGTLPAETIEITQYLPEGLTLNAANAQGWTAVNDSTITITLNAGDELPTGGLAAGEMYMVFIQTVVSEEVAMGKLTAHAEISDDGAQDDHDSTPDNDRTNDAGGEVNTSSDDRTDQVAPADEDDEDPVQIMLLEFDLALTEELITDGPIAPGDSVTTKIKVFNQGDISADSIKLFAYIPEGLNLADDAWMVMNDSTAMLTLTVADGNLPTGGLVADEMTMVTIDFIIDPSFTDTVLITFAEIGDATDENGNPVTDVDSTPDGDNTNDVGGEVNTPTDDEVDETAPTDEDDHDPAKIVVDQRFDLALEKSTDSTIVRLGDLVTYQIKVTNEGTIDAYRIGVTDFIPNGMSLQDGNWTASGDTARYNTPIAFLAAGQETTIDITLQVDAGFTSTSLVNIAEISAADDDTDPTNTPPTDEDSTPDEDPTNEDEDDDDPAVVTVLPPSGPTDIFDLAITETLAPGQEGMVRPGETVDFKITVFNQGNVAADTIKIMQYLPEGLTLNTANAQGWTNMDDSTAMLLLTAGNGLPVGGLVPGEMEMVMIQTVVSTTPSNNKLTAYAEISDDGVENTDIDSTPDDNRTNDVGGVPNTGTDDTTDQIPPTDEDDHDPVQIMLLEFDLALTEELITEGPITPGDSITTKVKVFNQGTIPADSIKLFAYIPAGLNLADDAWMTMNDSTAMRTLTVADGDIPTGGLVPDEMTMVTIDFIVDPSFMDTCLISYAEIGDATDENGQPVTDIDSTPDGDNTNDAGGEVNTTTDNEVDETAPTDEDDHDPVKILVDQRFDLALEKSTTATVVRWGDLVTYQIKITNEGTIDAYRIGVTDFLPTGMSLQDDQWTASGDTLRYNTPIAYLAAGQVETIDITLQVNNGVTSTSLVNTAEISSADDDEDPDNTPPTDEDSTPDEDPTNEDEDDDDSTVVTVLPPADEDPTKVFDLAIVQTLAPDQEGMVRPDEMVDFKITVFNQGNVAADTIKIMEYLPAGLTLNTANLQGWTSMDDSTAMILLTAGNGLPVGGLAPDSMVMVMIQTVVTTDAPTNKLTAYVEISEDGVNNEDVDSTPDEDRTNDTGGVPNTGSDDTVDQIPPTDEDDHDPVQIMLLEFDIATTIELITDETVMPGDSVTGKIKVFNQGDIPADNIKLFAYIPTGMSLADDAWTAMDDSTAMLTLTVTGGVLPDEMTMVTIDFMIDPDFMEECITVYTEIGGATDENGDTVTDVDSTPDDNRTNDAGGEVDTATDNEVNETPPTDEDDHDPMQVCVNQTFDLALKIELAPDQELEILNDDTVCFNITVINQGTQDAYDIGIVNYVPEGLIFDAGFNQGLGHNWQSDSTYVLPELPVGESAIIPIKFLSDVELLDSIIIDTAEIYFATNEDGSTVNTSDIDSQADEVNEDVIGGDNITNNDRGDEDDHDFVYVIPLMEVDPIGFIYADKTGKIIKGGTISVSAPPGGIVFMIEDGSDGMYQWFTNGVQGEYTMTYTHPDGLVMSPNCNPQTGVYDPTGRDGDATDMDGDATNGIIQLGTVDVTSDSLYLLNPTCGNNPYYLRFFLQSGDPIIDGNNLPIEESFIGSIVCDDTNGNGQPDAGELGIPNAPVYLYNCSDTLNPIDSTRTDALGKYAFDGLNAGNYMVQFTAPDGYRLPVDAVPMNVIAARNGFSECIALTTGECDTTTTVCMTACAKPVPTISASTIIEGESVTVSVTGGPDFIWSPNTGITDSATSTVTLQPTTSTTYSVKIEDTFGCSDTVSIPIQVTPLEEHFVRIANPCECTTASINGTPVFNDRITIYSRTPNENWTITENSGIYLAVGLAPVGTAFTAGGLVDGYYTYTLPIQHLDAAGYAGKFSNGTKTLEASNICFANQSCITTVVTTPDGTPGPPVTEEVLVIPPGSTPLIDTLANCAGTNFRSEGAEDNVLYKDTTARNNVLTVCAQNSWQSLKVTFTDFDLAAGDTLFVFDGKDTLQSKLIGKFSGAGVSQTGGWLASNCDPSINSDGCLTFQFKTNGDNAKGLGWRTNITCIDYNITLTPPNNLNAKLDCEDSYQVFDIRPATIKSDCGTIQDSQIVRIINGSGMVCIDTCLAGTDVIRDTFAIGSYLVQYKLKSDTAKTAQGILTVQGPSHVCNDELTIPLGSACGAMLTPDDLLENPCDTLTDTLYYFISIIGTDKNGNDKVLASGGGKGGNYPMVTKEMIDQCDGSVKAKIERRYYEGLNLTFCNNGPQTLSCETTVNLIDQLAPIFQTTAKVDTFKLCGAELTAEALGITPPIAIDNCDTVAVKFVNATILTDGGTCDTTRATLNWTATDACGNVGTLAQSVVILRPDAADVVRAPDVVLSCGEDTEATFNDFSKTKMPGIKIGKVVNGQLVPTDTVNLTTTDYVCGYILQKRDVRVDADCGSKVFRYWDIVDWCDPERGVNPLDTQFIELRDTLAPKFVADSLLPQSVVLDHYSCTFDVNQLVKPAATDNCSAVTVRLDSVFRIENSQPWGVPTSELAKLDCDSFLLRYVAEDACHEQLKNDTIAQIILIEDKTKPAVVCTDRINISLGRDAARIHYREIDQGSYDACGIATYEVSRDEVNWDTIVTVTCDDVHQEVKVYLRVSDRKGNQNTCWMTVNVEDKIAPICSDLPDVTGTCDEGHGDNLATTDANEDGKMSDNEWVDLTTDQANDWNTRYGNPVCSDNVTCIALVVEQQYQLIEKSCGIKQIKRRFRAVDWDGKGRVSNWSEQNILIEPKANWSITLPVDWQGSCGENVPVSNIFVTNGACDMMAYEVEEKVFTSVEETCLKVVRTFTIINWCTYEVGDPVVTIGRDENQHGMVTQSNIITSKHFEKASKLEYVQILKLTDETAPEVTVDAVDECIKDGDCQAVKTFAITAEDCTEAATRALRYSWTLSTNGQQLSRGETNSFEATVAANTPYEVVWKVTDNCGNSTIKRENYVFKDCKKPAPYCLHGLAVELMSTGMVQVWASDVERGSSDNCSSADKLRYRIWHNSLGDAPTNLSEVLALPEVITFNCNYLGVQDVHLYTLDEAGNWDFCTTYVDIQDNGNACENTETVDEMSLVSGTIMDWQQRTVEEVMVYASATEGSNNQMMTKTDGHYHFELPMYRNYTIQPEKDDNPLNGVSTFDLVLIAKHILGIEPFENPYQMIAADVNSSGTVTAFDMVQIRQVILNIYPTFSNGSSWKFVDAQYEFSTDSPMTEGYPETVQFGDLRTDEVANFVAIKLGDVDGNARPNSLVSSEDRTTRSTFEISVHDQYLEAGKTYQVAFKGEQLHEIQGYQFTLGYEDLSIVQLQGGVAGVENFGLHRLEEGMITTSWNQSSKQKPSTLLENNLSDTSSQFSETLFFVELTAQRDGKLSELLRLRNNPTSIEAYSQQGELMDVQLTFTTPVFAEPFELFQNQPNPFNDRTEIGFYLPGDSEVHLVLRDEIGRILGEYKAERKAGYNVIEVDGEQLTNGFIYYQLSTKFGTKSKKMLRLD